MLQQATGIGAPPPVVRVGASSSPLRNTSMSPHTATSSERGYYRRRVPSPTRRNAGRRPRSLNETARKEGRWCHADQPSNTRVLPSSTSRMPEDNPTSPPRQHMAEQPMLVGETMQAEAYNRESATQHALHRAADGEQLQNTSRMPYNTMAAPPPPPPPPPQQPPASSASARSLSLMPAASSEQQPRVDSGEVQRGALLLELKRSASGWGSQMHDELVPAAVLRESAGGTDIVTPTDRELKQAAAVLRSTPAPAPKSKKAPPPSPRMRGSNGSATSGPDQSPGRKRSAPPVNSLPGPSVARAGGGSASRAEPSGSATPPVFPDGRMPLVRYS